MKSKLRPETCLVAEGASPHIGLWTPQKLGVLGIVATVTLLLSVQGGMVAAIILLSKGFPGMGPLVNACCVLVGTVLFVTRRRWLQALGLGINLAGGVYPLVTTPFFYSSVMNPQTFSGGGLVHMLSVLPSVALIVVCYVASWVTVVRNYQVTPHWRAWFSGACWMVLGTFLSLVPISWVNGGWSYYIGQIIPLSLTIVAMAVGSALLVRNALLMLQRNFWFAGASCAAVGMVLSALFLGAISPLPPAAALSFDPLQAPHFDPGAGVPQKMNMGMPNAPLSVTQLQTPSNTGAHVDHLTLTAEAATLTLNNGVKRPTWTFNGTAPGPVLRVKQGDLVDVTLINHLPFGVTIHWHGIRLANAADGVAGLTQDAVKPGQTYEYRFIPPDAGTYWYHSHQFSDVETSNGLFGVLIVDPATASVHADVDTQVALHTWNDANGQAVYTMDTADSTGDATLSTAGALIKRAKAGQWVRLRIVNTNETASGRPLLVTLVGARFKVISLDGQDLNGPAWLQNTPLPIGSAQRYDILFQIPAQGSVALVTTGDTDPNTQASYRNAPAMLFTELSNVDIRQGMLPKTLPGVGTWFDLTTYGTPAADSLTASSHFDIAYTVTLGFEKMGLSLGRATPVYTMNSKVFPYSDMLMVKEGQRVELHLVNTTDLFHPIHLHGHIMALLAANGRPLSGSPVHLDTVLLPPHSSYDVAFLANNPGLWMLHCHNLQHADFGMDMMLAYNVSTPYTIGTVSGNFPD